jgi:prolipoprotein diacylglyceryltransferase
LVILYFVGIIIHTALHIKRILQLNVKTDYRSEPVFFWSLLKTLLGGLLVKIINCLSQKALK